MYAFRSNEEPKYEISRVARAYAFIFANDSMQNNRGYNNLHQLVPVNEQQTLKKKHSHKKEQQPTHYLYIHNHCDTFFIFIS